MKINIGSKNGVKVAALKEAIADYEIFKDAVVDSFEIESGVSDQPKTLEETVFGAKNRSKRVFEKEGCDFAFGIESGFFEVADSKTGLMEMTVCSIFNGEEFALGCSSAFECPSCVMNLVNNGLDLTQACHKAGLTDNPEIGKAEGIVGILTKGRVARKDYTKQAITMALIHIENKNIY